jgi:hypothetical protein
MNLLLGIIAVVAVFISGLLGLTAGINLNPISTVSYVPNWGSLGDWVSGIGAFLAIISSFILVKRNEEQQRDRERERFLVDQFGSLLHVSITVVSTGYLPCAIKGVFIESLSKSAVPLHRYLPEDVTVVMPQRLESKADIHFSWRFDQLEPLLQAISWMRVGRLEDLTILVVTSIGEDRTPITAEVAEILLGVARGAGIAVLETDEPF